MRYRDVLSSAIHYPQELTIPTPTSEENFYSVQRYEWDVYVLHRTELLEARLTLEAMLNNAYNALVAGWPRLQRLTIHGKSLQVVGRAGSK